MIFSWDDVPVEPHKVTIQASMTMNPSESMDSQGRAYHGDCVDAMTLVPSGSVKCVYMDPPYNMGFHWGSYDDKTSTDSWLSFMSRVLTEAWRTLTLEGSLWCSIDDRSGHLLRMLMDKVLGADKFVATIVWQKRYSRENRGAIGDAHEYIHVYAKDYTLFTRSRNFLDMTPEQLSAYKNPDNDPKGPWRTQSLSAQGRKGRENQYYDIVSPTGKIFRPPAGRCWRYIERRYKELEAQGLISFGKDGEKQPVVRVYLSDNKGMTPQTWWEHEFAGHNDGARRECKALFGDDFDFGTPKPEKLLGRILDIASNEGDVVLDPFGGCGTTAAVALKMGRRFVTAESSDTFGKYIIPRLLSIGKPFESVVLGSEPEPVGDNDFSAVFGA